MDWISNIFFQISIYVSIPYLLTFILLSYLVKTYFGDWIQKVTKFNFKTVYIVLIIATLLGISFWLLIKDLQWHQILFSYAVGTSLHELIFQHIENLIIKKS